MMPAKQKRILLVLVFLLAAGVVATTTLLAQTSPGFDLSWHVIGNGGGESSSASFQVNGTIGQAAAGPPTLGSARFTVNSGYWAGDAGTAVYLPLILKNQGVVSDNSLTR
jgi:hypothetical protein